ncbi:MAG: glycoside hydrolase family 3 N-terminal domain-containing protein [Cyclobacteriaceae bacterium]
MKRILFLITLLISIRSIAQTDPPKDSIDAMIGQMIMIGIGDFNNFDKEQSIFQEIEQDKVGGIVLYEKNINPDRPKKELARLIGGLQKNAKIPLFVSIDEEGGRVTRLKTRYGFPKNVSAGYLGKINNLDSTGYYASQTASLLSSFGINMNYAPVVDVNLNPENPVIGKLERSFSSEYHQVIRHSHEVISRHNGKQVVPVLKHFPGHGSSRSDTHLGLTDISDTWQFEEMYPYAALIDSGVVKAIMTAHIVHKSLDRTKIPATLSGKVITGLLREFLNYDGVIISDDMQMGAIKNEYGTKEAIRMSIDAGVDILMFANNVKDFDMITASTVHGIIRDLLAEGVITRERIYASYNRIMKLKDEFGLTDAEYSKSLKNKLKAY